MSSDKAKYVFDNILGVPLQERTGPGYEYMNRVAPSYTDFHFPHINALNTDLARRGMALVGEKDASCWFCHLRH